MNIGNHKSNGSTYRLEVSNYDRTASLFLSLVTLLAEVETELRRLVQQRKEMDWREEDAVKRTLFGVRKAGSQGFEFFVMKQSYQ